MVDTNATTPTTESTSTTAETSAPANFNDAFDAAFAEAENEHNQAQETTEETTTTPAEEKGTTTKVEEEPTVEDDEDAILSLSPDELEEIKSNPATRKLYKSLMKASTQKFQEIAANKRILDAYQRDPEGTIRALAQHHGIAIADAQPTQATPSSEAVDEVMQEMQTLFGPDAAKALKPLFEKLTQRVVEKEISPLREEQETLKLLGAAKQAEALAGGFRGKHEDLSPEIEAKMVQIGQRIMPSNDMDPSEYLETLYTLATAGSAKTSTAKEVVERMKKAANSAEPRRSMPSDKVTKSSSVKKGMTFDQAFDAAWDEAAQEA